MDEKLKSPLKIGIIYFEKRYEKRSLVCINSKEKKINIRKINNVPDPSRIYLNFDQLICSHLLLQLNALQKTFLFEIIDHNNSRFFEMPMKKDIKINLVDWFCNEINLF